MRMTSPVLRVGRLLSGLWLFSLAGAAVADEAASAQPLPRERAAPLAFIELGAHLAFSNADRFGATLEPALLYRWGRFELGASVQLLGLWANDGMPLIRVYPDRTHRDLTLMPRAVLGYRSKSGLLRSQLTAGYGPSWMRSEGGSPELPLVDRTHWSYGVGLGFSAGVFHGEVQWLGYLRHAEEDWSIILGEGSTDPRGSAGGVASLGVAFPIALDGSTGPATER